MFLSVKMGLILFSFTILPFLITFIAYSRPVSFFLTKTTLLKAPLPIIFICSKSCLLTLLLSFVAKLIFAKWALRNSPF